MMKRILITGGSGFLGQHLANKLRANSEITLASRNHKRLFEVGKALKVETHPLDISSLNSVNDCVQKVKPDVIIHAAATKFVDWSQKFPNECIDINILGSQNVYRSAITNKIPNVIGISTDKVVYPIGNFYGLSKRVMEDLFLSTQESPDTQFSCVRFGNIAWSTGSVFPIWQKMLQESRVIESSGSDMFRFFFSVDEAVALVLTAINNPSVVAGKILTKPMKSCQMNRILDLWTRRTNSSWIKIPTREGDSSNQFLVSEDEITFSHQFKLDSESLILISKKSKTELSLRLRQAYSSVNAPQLTDQEINDLIDKAPREIV